MTPERFKFIMEYQFKLYYESEMDWRRDFERFCTSLNEFDSTHSTKQVIHESNSDLDDKD